MELKTENLIPENSSPGPDKNGTFNLLAVSPTDIWRKPPKIDNFNAPIIYHSIPISSFKSAHVTAKGEWLTLYDQGGLFLVLPPKKGSEQKRWIKSGVEFYQGKPMMSVVAADEWADWSLLSLATRGEERNGSVTVEFEREQEEDGSWGSVLRVLLVGRFGVKTPIREISWAFWDVDESEELWIGMYAAKPISDIRDTLAVQFEDFVVEARTD
ncbi:Uncharacterized protein LCER1_G003079 [Lachnellula cervina]|uniref:Uncharacterized protein n=1 Tax=Lachnellula cervina TaxID=1316786 RepID=A0A7D8YWT7_9HELO|nr:Uncharacterized protein LCER1_G003079 [Lachnellula cervina]